MIRMVAGLVTFMSHKASYQLEDFKAEILIPPRGYVRWTAHRQLDVQQDSSFDLAVQLRPQYLLLKVIGCLWL
jgi:hypothetical protein